MKKLTLLFVLALAIQVTVSSQPCLPSGITFTTQVQIDSFQTNYPNCTEIGSNVEIIGWNNITNLNGLSVITTIDGYLHIGDGSNGNNLLTSLEGLNNLGSVGGSLVIFDNALLTDLSGLEVLKTIGGELSISENYNLISLTGLDSLSNVGGDLHISDGAFTDFAGLNALTSIGGGFWIAGNSNLQDLSGLNASLQILGSLNIMYNDSLSNFLGLDSLSSIGGDLFILSNEILTDFAGLENLESIGGSLRINGNDSLNSLTNLENLTSVNGISIGGASWVNGNHALTSLVGLDNIDADSISSLYITFNSVLATCEVQSICEYLTTPGGTIEIHDNATGCDSQEEVEEACEALVVKENDFNAEFSIHPNPAAIKIFITSKNGLKIETVDIYNQLGQKVLHRNDIKGNIDISTLRQGIYIIELTSNELKYRQKLIIEE